MLHIRLHVFIKKQGNHSRVIIDTILCFIVLRLANTQAVAWSTPSDPGAMRYVRLRFPYLVSLLHPLETLLLCFLSHCRA